MMTYDTSRVRDALIAAADTELRLRGPRGPSGPRSAWPVHRREHADVAGWYEGEDIAETALTVTAPERKHHDMVTAWLRMISSVADRKLVWAWATATARGAWLCWCAENRRDAAETAARVDGIVAGLTTKLNASRTITGATTLQTPRDRVVIRQ
jgi:hypothetical protein